MSGTAPGGLHQPSLDDAVADPLRAAEHNVLRVDVRYRLFEYVAFAVEHACDTDAFVHAAPRWQQRAFAVVLAGVATLTFIWKSLRMGRCSFVIDADHLERRSRRGTSGIPWARVKAVHVYRRGYLVELAHGAVPLPFRVFRGDARALFETFAGPRLRPGDVRH